ncbi:MAG: GAF domain-containing protein [Actinobacteria bacterium]|nr:GAF domain-containing protein [Actinomycetota bacterium]MCL5883443.1 GAF domain-containing protein [Actinomycetota bacterium]
MGCEAMAISLRDGDHWVMRYTFGFPEEFNGPVVAGRNAMHLNLISQTRKPVVVLDARTDERIDPELAGKLGIRSPLSVPLIVKKEVIGDIAFASLSKPAAFSQAQLDFAVKTAAAISLAIENARLYEIEGNIAHTLQEAILTLPAAMPGIDIGHLYRSATETMEVGGDFYDLFERCRHENVDLVPRGPFSPHYHRHVHRSGTERWIASGRRFRRLRLYRAPADPAGGRDPGPVYGRRYRSKEKRRAVRRTSAHRSCAGPAGAAGKRSPLRHL